MRKVLAVLGILVLLSLANYLIKREVDFILLTEDSEQPELQAELYLDNESIFKGEVGHQMFGYRHFKKRVSGGFHSLKIVSNSNQITEENYFCFI